VEIPAEPRSNLSVYRLVSRFSRNPSTGLPKKNLFRRRPNEEGLSVYRTDMQTPRGALQCCIDAQKRKLESGEPELVAKAERFLREDGSTVGELLEHGWGVVKIALTEFTDRGFKPSDPEPDGHVNIFGTETAFETYSKELVDLAQLLPEDECRR